MLQRWISALALTSGMGLLVGCGAVSESGGIQTGLPANVAGNWLLAGTLPTVGNSPPVSTGVTATFDVTGTNVVGIITAQFPCSQGFAGNNYVGGVVSGPVAADGSFTLQTAAGFPGNTATLAGHLPLTAGGNWTGTYTVSTTTCGTFTGQIAATPIPFVSGTFAGSTTLGWLTPPPSSTPVTLRINLLQGGYETAGGISLYSNTVLGGTIAITGSSCLTSGTTTGATPVPGAVEGNTVLAYFVINDGSTVQMLGSISSADSTKLQVSFLSGGAGSCNTGFITPSVQLLKQ